MAYKPTIPASSDFISISQTEMLENFKQVGTQWLVDHVPLTNAEDDELGNHKKLTLVEQSSDPTTGTNYAALYSKAVGGVSELHFRNEGGTVNQITSAGALSQNGLRLGAFVVFDLNGNILEVPGPDDDQGRPTKQKLKYNVASVTKNLPAQDDWTVTYTTSLSTANYMWVVQWYALGQADGIIPRGRIVQPMNDASYANTVTAAGIRLHGMFTDPSTTSAPSTQGQITVVQLQAWTVV